MSAKTATRQMVIEFVNLGQGIFMEGYGNNAITGNIATGIVHLVGSNCVLTAADAPPVTFRYPPRRETINNAER